MVANRAKPPKCPRCGDPMAIVGSGVASAARCKACGVLMPVPREEAGPPQKPATLQVVLACPECRRKLRLTRALGGKKIRCKTCFSLLSVGDEPFALSVVGQHSTDGLPENFPRPPRQVQRRRDVPDTDLGWDLVEAEFAGISLLVWKRLGVFGGALSAGVLLLIALLWWVFHEPADPLLGFLPATSYTVASIDFEQVHDSPVCKKIGPDAFLAGLSDYDVFLSITGLRKNGLIRLRLGYPSDGSDPVLVYEFARPFSSRSVLSRKSLQSWGIWKLTDENIRGVTLHSIGTIHFVIANSTTIITGNGDAIRDMLHSRASLPNLFSQLKDSTTSDQSPAVVAYAAYIPEKVTPALIAPEPELRQDIRGMVTTVEYDSSAWVERICTFADDHSAKQYRRLVERTIRAWKEEDHGPKAAQFLASLNVTCSDTRVGLRMAIPPENWDSQTAKWLAVLLK
jgi:hypothetical protein